MMDRGAAHRNMLCNISKKTSKLFHHSYNLFLMKFQSFFTSLLLLLFSANLIAQVEVYVSTTGADVFGNGDIDHPYLTIAFAVEQAPPGSIVYISPGTYNETREIYINKPLNLVKNGNGEVIIDAIGRTSPTENKYMIGIVNANLVTIDGLTLKNCTGNGSKGIWVLGSGSIITIKNCSISNIGWVSNNLTQIPPNNNTVANAIRIEGTKPTALSAIYILNNDVHNCATGWGEAISIVGNIDGFQVENNMVHEISNIGIVAAGNYAYTGAPPAVNQARNGLIRGNNIYHCMSPIANSAGIYLDGSINCTVSRNRIHDNAVGISVGGEEAVGAGAFTSNGHRVFNNLIYNNSVTGIYIGSNNPANAVLNTTVYNNTIFKNRTGAAINGVSIIGGETASSFADDFGGDVLLQNIEDVKFKNNIIYPLTNKRAVVALEGYTVNNFVSDYNIYFREDAAPLIDLTGLSFNGLTLQESYSTLTDFTAATSLEAHSFFAEPGFVDTATFNFSLTSTAFAIDKGDTAYSIIFSDTLDFAKNKRVYNSRIDVGAYESQIAPLAVNFIEPYQATKVEAGVKIEWTTANETNSSHFDIERSVDGINFRKIASIAAQINSHTIHHYSTIDTKPARETNYYRLKQVDLDGKFTYTPLLVVSYNSVDVQFYPNPVANTLFVESKSSIERITIQDLLGKTIMTIENPGKNVDLTGLSSGQYIILFQKSKEEIEVSRFIKN